MSFEQTLEQRADVLTKAIDFAGKYVRTFDPELLAHLYRTIVEHTLPPSASLQEHAELNGQRKLIIGIIRQYQLATTGNPETPCAFSTLASSKPSSPMPPQEVEPRRRQRRT